MGGKESRGGKDSRSLFRTSVDRDLLDHLASRVPAERVISHRLAVGGVRHRVPLSLGTKEKLDLTVEAPRPPFAPGKKSRSDPGGPRKKEKLDLTPEAEASVR